MLRTAGAPRHGAAVVLVCLLSSPALADSTERVSVDFAELQANGNSSYPSVSADGRFVAFASDAANLAAGDTNAVNDIFVRDRQTGVTERVSVDSNETQADFASANDERTAISADGRFVAFRSAATNLVPGDTGFRSDIFVRDRQAGTTERVSVDGAEVEADESSFKASISGDGRFVAFESSATNLVAVDSNGSTDVFVRDRQLGATELVSVNSAEAQGSGSDPSISADGRYVAFASSSTNLVTGDSNGKADIFVRDRQTGTTERVSVDSAEAQTNDGSNEPSISADGRFVAFTSVATNLVAGDTNTASDIFVRDRQTGVTTRVSVNSAAGQANGTNREPSVSADGRFVSFHSLATNLVAGDSNGVYDVFVHDRLAGTTQRVSVDSVGAQANADNTFYGSAIAGDGRFVVFHSVATNLVANDTNAKPDVFLRDRGPIAVPVRLAAGDFDGDNRDDLVGDFGARGVWVLRGGTSAWVNLHPGDAGGFASGDFDATGRDELAVDFDAGGLWARYNNASWTRLHAGNAEELASANLDANIRQELIADFGAAGLWVRYNNTATWTQRHTVNVEGLTAGDLDGNGRRELIVDFGAGGIWAFFNNTNWTRLNTANPESLKSGDLDGGNRYEVIADLGAAGLAARYNNTTTWTTLHPTNPEGVAVGDFDASGRDDLAVDFGGGGLWVRLNNATWTRVHTTNPQGLATADFDGNNKAELIVDFGAGGLWARYNNATWTRLPALPP